MPKDTRVHPEHLLVSGVCADSHTEDLHVSHTTADGRIEAAQPGMPGMAAAAMSVKVAKWRGVTAALFARITDHGQALRTSGLAFDEADHQNAQDISQVGSQTTNPLADL